MTVQELMSKLDRIEDKGLQVLIEKDLYDEEILRSIDIRETSVLLSIYKGE